MKLINNQILKQFYHKRNYNIICGECLKPKTQVIAIIDNKKQVYDNTGVVWVCLKCLKKAIKILKG